MKLVEGKPFFTKSNNFQFKYLDKNIRANKVIIGGGITGLLIAYYFSKNNIDTIILEKNRIGYGSTSITTALLQYELDDNVNVLRNFYTYEELKEIYLACNDSLFDLEQICLEINCPYTKNKCMLYTSSDIEKKELYDEHIFRQSIGLNSTFIKYNDEIKHGIVSENGLSFNPYEFSVLLSKYLSDKKVYIFENTEVIKIDYLSKLIYTNYNVVAYNKIICATGYDINMFTNKKIGNTYYTYNIVTKEVEVKNNYLIRDNKDPYNYYRYHNQRIIAGGYDTLIYDEKNLDNIYNNLLNNVKKVYNINTEIEYKYCGVFKSTKDNLGYFYKEKEDLYLALGYGANGIVFANIGAQIILDDLNNKENKLKKYFDIKGRV